MSDLLLDTLPGHVAVGELFYLLRNGVQYDSLCGCGRQFSECDFWQSVGERAVGGWSSLDLDTSLRLQQRIDRTAAIPFTLIPSVIRRRLFPSFSRDLDAYTDFVGRVYRAILDEAGADVVVDSSKRPSLAYLLRSMPDVDLRTVQVVRDPRAVAYSFSKTVDLPPSSDIADIMPRSRPRKVARRWVTTNMLIGTLRWIGVPGITVRYEDLASEPLAQLVRVARLENLDDDTIDRSVLSTEGLRVARAHLVAGGRIRLVDGLLPIRLDEAWRREMPQPARRLVSLLTAASRLGYGYR